MRLNTKKRAATLAAATLLAGSGGAALAQSSVTVYGLIDIGLVHESGGAAGAVNKISSGMSHGSRLGFKGVEDLGGGLSALFLLESGFQPDTGALGQGGLLFGRQSYVGLSGNFGTVTAGRQYSSQYNTLVLADPFSTGLAGDAKNLMPSTGDANTRVTNSIKFATPAYRGFSGELMYAPGEVAGDSDSGLQLGGALAYAAGPLNVRLGYHYRNNDTAATPAASSARDTLLAATWDFGPVKGHVGYGVDKGLNSAPLRNTSNPYGYAVAPTGSTDSTDLLLGLSAPYGRHTFLASYIRKDDKTAPNQDARQFALGYRYAFSKRTDAYVSLAHITNRNGASYSVGSSIEAGTGNRAASVGIRHQF